ncbi:hypothetical protein [Acidovorax temperans]|uniref:hypothetical protein n=1 Tax=Acidovorax temperans TaxID=80878 RepID=UPI00289B4202|nr:hypothetical protein [Acidovorax temperans]
MHHRPHGQLAYTGVIGAFGFVRAHALCVQGCIDLGDGQASLRSCLHMLGAIGSSPEAIERIVFFTLANTAGTVARSVGSGLVQKEQFGISALSER